MKKEMFLKQTGKGNKSSEPEDNTASREATTETIPLFIYFNSSPTFKAVRTAGSACSALQILHVSLCSVCGNKWIFPPFQLKFVGPLPWPPKTQRQKSGRTLHHHSALKHCSSTPKPSNPKQRDSTMPEYFFPTVSSTNWAGNDLVCKCHTGIHPTSCTGLYPNYPNSGQYWETSESEHFQLSAHILSLHWLFTTSKTPPVISKSKTHFSSVYCRPSAASCF